MTNFFQVQLWCLPQVPGLPYPDYSQIILPTTTTITVTTITSERWSPGLSFLFPIMLAETQEDIKSVPSSLLFRLLNLSPLFLMSKDKFTAPVYITSVPLPFKTTYSLNFPQL